MRVPVVLYVSYDAAQHEEASDGAEQTIFAHMEGEEGSTGRPGQQKPTAEAAERPALCFAAPL